MKQIIIIIIICLASMCFGTQVFAQTTYIDRALDIKAGLSFNKNSDFGIMRTNTTGTVTVSVFDKDSYKDGHNGSSDSFMYGFESGANTDTYENIPFAINGRYHWYCLYGVCQFNFQVNDGFVYDSSNSLKVFKRAIKAKAHYTQSNSNQSLGFYSIITGKIDVVIKIDLSNGATLANIKSIKIPGMEPIENDIAPRIEVYRGNNIIPVTTIKFADFATSELVVYEGDSLVFKRNGSIHTQISGLTDIAIARWAGESIFMTEEDIRATHKPFLFFDSNVHGVKMRTYPESWKGKNKYPQWKKKTELTATETSKYWIANRRRDYLIDNPDKNHNNQDLWAYKKAVEFKRDGFPNANKFSEDLESLSIQRNNQKEGLNVELLDAYEGGLDGVAGLDPDELIYHSYAQSDIAGNYHALSKEFTYVTKDRWKKIEQSAAFINATLIKSFGRIRKFIANNDDLTYSGHEILDKNLFVHKDIIEKIDGEDFNYKKEQPMFNFKRPIVFNPLKTNKPLMHLESQLKWTLGTDTKKINIAVLSPLEGKRVNRDYDKLTEDQRKNPQVNFYGIIEGPTFVARNQENVRYSVKNLPTSTEVPGRFELVYSYEDSNGFLTEKRKIVANNDNYIEITFGGGGYHEITLQYKRNKDENATPVIIAGKELIDVDLRFIFSPNAKDAADFSNNPEETFGKGGNNIAGLARLKENKGSGKRWFLDDENKKMKEDGYGLKHGYKDHNVVRTYNLSTKETLTLTVLDADPHNFTHYQPDWYLSERRLSKRVTDKELENPKGQHKIQWFWSLTLDFKNQTSLGYGKHKNIVPPKRFLIGPHYPTFYVKAVYNNKSEIKVKFNIRKAHATIGEIIQEADQNIGVVKTYNLSEDQFKLFNQLRAADETNDNETDQINLADLRIIAIKDLFSSYEYNDSLSPRYRVSNEEGVKVEVGEHKRFSPRNNFDARFEFTFKIKEDNDPIKAAYFPYDFSNHKDPTLENWFPYNWIRHLDGTPQSPEIPTFNKVSYIKPFVETKDPNIVALFNKEKEDPYTANIEALYEPWQVRLPWIAQSGLHGYKTRWNIKTIYDIDKIFTRSEVGKAYRDKSHTTIDYHDEVTGMDAEGRFNGDKIIPNFSSTQKEFQEFYWHLKTGRMVIINVEKFKNNLDPGGFLTTKNLLVKVTNNPKDAQKKGHVIFKGWVKFRETASKTANGIESAISKTDFSIYPNPINDGKFSLEFNLREKGFASFEIFNIAGQLMYQKKNQNLDQGNHKIEFGKNDVNLASGVYLFKVVTPEYTETRKLFVE